MDLPAALDIVRGELALTIGEISRWPVTVDLQSLSCARRHTGVRANKRAARRAWLRIVHRVAVEVSLKLENGVSGSDTLNFRVPRNSPRAVLVRRSVSPNATSCPRGQVPPAGRHGSSKSPRS